MIVQGSASDSRVSGVHQKVAGSNPAGFILLLSITEGANSFLRTFFLEHWCSI